MVCRDGVIGLGCVIASSVNVRDFAIMQTNAWRWLGSLLYSPAGQRHVAAALLPELLPREPQADLG